VCSITGVACEYRAHLEILSSLLSLSLSDIHPQRATVTFTTRSRTRRWPRDYESWTGGLCKSDDVRLSMWDFLQSVAGGMARFVDGSERCDVHRTWRRRVLTRDRLWIHRAGRRTLRAFPL